MPAAPAPSRSVALVTLGCVRNEVDSEELAGRLAGAGWDLAEDAGSADVVVVNTCGFIEQAKKDSVDALLEAADLKGGGADGTSRTRAVVAVGCMAERYGTQLADELPEADAVLGFDSYADLGAHLGSILDGGRPASHVPRDRRTLLPLSPAARRDAPAPALPGHGDAGPGSVPDLPVGSVPDLPAGVAPASGPPVVRRRLDGRPWAPLKLASGCDRRCTFCAIPMFRGAFLSRRPADVLTEARWLAEQGVKEVFLVSENSTSYGKDLGDIRLLESLLPELSAIEGIDRVRVSYLQPAEVRPGLLEAMAGTPGVASYFDLSFQHSAPAVLRRMRRFGSTDDFLALLDRVRALAPTAGVRSNVIVGFPGETEADVEELTRFIEVARLDVVGVFGYSDEDGTEAAGLDGKLDAAEVAARLAHVGALAEEMNHQRAEERAGEEVVVLVEELEDGEPVGRAAHQGPDVDGVTYLVGGQGALKNGALNHGTRNHGVGEMVTAVVTGTEGVDLLAEPR